MESIWLRPQKTSDILTSAKTSVMVPPIASPFFQFILLLPFGLKQVGDAWGNKDAGKKSKQEEHEYSSHMLMHTTLHVMERSLWSRLGLV